MKAELSREQIDNFVRDRLLVYLKKNKDYGNSFDASLDKYGAVAFDVRAEDKLNRIKRLMNNPANIHDESVYDSVLDLYNYTSMFLAWDNDCSYVDSILSLMMQLMDNDFYVFIGKLTFRNLLNAEDDAKVIEFIKDVLMSEAQRF